MSNLYFGYDLHQNHFPTPSSPHWQECRPNDPDFPAGSRQLVFAWKWCIHPTYKSLFKKNYVLNYCKNKKSVSIHNGWLLLVVENWNICHSVNPCSANLTSLGYFILAWKKMSAYFSRYLERNPPPPIWKWSRDATVCSQCSVESKLGITTSYNCSVYTKSHLITWSLHNWFQVTSEYNQIWLFMNVILESNCPFTPKFNTEIKAVLGHFGQYYSLMFMNIYVHSSTHMFLLCWRCRLTF